MVPTVGGFSLPQPVCKEIKQIETNVKVVDHDQIVAMSERATKLLVANDGALEDVQVKSRNMGGHPKNRDNEQLSAARAHSRVDSVRGIGFSWKRACLDAVAFQDHPMKKHIGKTMEKLCRMSDSYAKYKLSECLYESVGASQFNHGLECASQGGCL